MLPTDPLSTYQEFARGLETGLTCQINTHKSGQFGLGTQHLVQNARAHNFQRVDELKSGYNGADCEVGEFLIVDISPDRRKHQICSTCPQVVEMTWT